MSIVSKFKRAIKKALNVIGFNALLHRVAFSFRPTRIVEYRNVQFRCSNVTEYERQLSAGKYNEDLVIGFMTERLRGIDGIFLDIGANLGVFSLTLAKACGFSVVAFEPEPLNFLKLQTNVRLNSACDVTTVNLACGERDGEFLDFTVPFDANRGVPFVGRWENPPLFAWELRVLSTRVDGWLFANPQKRIAGFKIDVESFEEYVLRGMKNVLSQPGPLRGLIELHPHIRPVDCASIVGMLASNGFSIAEITREGVTTPYHLSRHDGHAIWVEKQ